MQKTLQTPKGASTKSQTQFKQSQQSIRQPLPQSQQQKGTPNVQKSKVEKKTPKLKLIFQVMRLQGLAETLNLGDYLEVVHKPNLKMTCGKDPSCNFVLKDQHFEAQDFVIECFGEKVFLLRQTAASQKLTFFQCIGQNRHDLRSYFPFLMEKTEIESPLVWLLNDIDNPILAIHYHSYEFNENGSYKSVTIRVARNKECLNHDDQYQEFIMEDVWRLYTIGSSAESDFKVNVDSPAFKDYPYIKLGVAPVHAILGFYGREKFVQQPTGIYTGIGVQYKTASQQRLKKEGCQFQLKNNQKIRCGPYLFQTSIVQGEEVTGTETKDFQTELVAFQGIDGEGNSKDYDHTNLRTSFADIQKKLSHSHTKDVSGDFQKIVELWECGKIQIIQPNMLKRTSNMIGKGAYGIVYEGLYLNFRVAIKQIEIKYTEFSDAVIKEILFLGELSGWNSFLTLFGIYIQARKDSLYVLIVTELCKCNLQVLLDNHRRSLKLKNSNNNRLSLKSQLVILHNISFGLDLFGFGITRIVHRDLKPENILITYADLEQMQGEKNLQEIALAKISDFGVSVRMPQFQDIEKGRAMEVMEETNKFEIAGTHIYMPFETLTQRITSFSGDIYALGLIAYQIFTGLLPWPQCKTQDDLIKAIKEKQSPLADDWRDKVDVSDKNIQKQIIELIQQSTSHDSEDRPSAKEFSDKIQLLISLIYV